MPAVSLNGWPVLDDGDPRIATGTIPGTTRRLTLNRVCLPLFLHFCAAWNKEMPARLKLTNPANEVDGLEVRQARNASGYSNHASGTAVDLAYRVLNADNQRHMTDAEQAILRAILNRYRTRDGHLVLSNGYLWRHVDEMHTELSQGWQQGAKRNTTEADVLEVCKRLGIRADGTSSLIGRIIGKLPTPKPKPVVGQGAAWCAKFLTDQGLTGSTHRIVWTLAGRESGWMPQMVYPAGAHDWASEQPPFDTGLLQVNSTHLPEVRAMFGPSATMRAMLDPVSNVRFSAQLSNNFTDFRAWGIGGVNADGSVRWDWSQYPQSWLDKVTSSGLTQREESQRAFLKIWSQYPNVPVKPTPTPQPATVSLAAVKAGQGPAVAVVQAALNRVVDSHLVVDGQWGPQTQSAYDRFRRSHMGLSGTAATGSVGVQSLTALGKAAGFRVTR